MLALSSTGSYNIASGNNQECSMDNAPKNFPKEYKSWAHMNGRCYCETNHKYPNYGGRG